MEIFIFVLLAAVWAAFLLPPLLKSRREAPISSTQEFDRSLARLAYVREYGRLQVAVSRRRIQARRRRVFAVLLLAAVVSLGLAIWQGSLVLLFVHLLVDALAVGYVAMLLHIKQRRAELPIVPAEEAPAEEGEVRLLASR
ncbi:MAG: hypothetical protein M3N51_06895 [Actinomycetota bacterium]|nr:hypothetical protein [Actinomycetota bacterium]